MKCINLFVTVLFLISCGDTQQRPENNSAIVSDSTESSDKEEEFGLISEYDCATCHRKDEKISGPAYMDIAGKYKNDKKAEEYLSRKILEGGSGVWGDVPMNSHPSMPKEDAVLLARYILSL